MYVNAAFLSIYKLIGFKPSHPTSKIMHFTLCHILILYILLLFFLNMRLALIINLLTLVSKKIR